MNTLSHSKLNVFDFGRALVSSGDLDPVYILLVESNLEGLRLKRFLLAYWCFYHLGTASWIVDQKDFKEAMMKAAKSKDYKRGSERRHFRGENAINSVRFLNRNTVAGLFKPLLKEQTAISCMWKVESWVGFGPWIAFKVADMLERLDLVYIEFEINSLKLFSSPKLGAFALRDRIRKSVTDDEACEWAIDIICNRLKKLKAPPWEDRPIGIQEAETILCKWKSYIGGRYHIGEDIQFVHKSLIDGTKTAKHLSKVAKEYL
jgi:hypothetical protein